MKNGDPNRISVWPKSAVLFESWLVGAIALAIFGRFSLLIRVTPIDNSGVYYNVATGHYAISLAMAFLLFSCIYFILDIVFAASYRRVLGWGHLGLMTAGAAMINGPSIFLRMTSQWPRPANSERAFGLLNAVSTVGYVLTLVGLFLFALMLGHMIIGRLNRSRP